MQGTVFVGVGCSRLLLVAPVKPHLECAHAVTKDMVCRCVGLRAQGVGRASGARGGCAPRQREAGGSGDGSERDRDRRGGW